MYRPYGVQVLALGYMETVATAAIERESLGLTYPVIADEVGDVVYSYTDPQGWGFPNQFPWNTIVNTDQILILSQDLFVGGVLNMARLIDVLESEYDPFIETDQPNLEFGTLEVGMSEQSELVITNGGTGILEVTDITTSHPDFSVDVTSGQIFAVDDEMTVTVTFVPSIGNNYYSETLTIHSPSGNVELPLTGHVGVEDQTIIPAEFGINCYPNPFNAELTVQLSLDRAQAVSVTLFDVQGRRMADLWQGMLSGGIHELRWSDQEAPSGLYLVEISGAEWKSVRKVMMLR